MPARYSALSHLIPSFLFCLIPKQVYYEPANGCSTPKGINWGWGNNDLFKSACDNHDTCYTTPGNPKGYCDRKMLSEMFKLCKDGSFLCKSWARDYFNAVNLGAQGAYDAAQKQEGEYVKAVYAWLQSAEPQVRGRAAVIQVIEATYGENCGVSRGNVTQHIASACNGRNSCTYTIDYTIIGDPAYGCAKNYSAQWRCGVNQKTYSAFASPEAGYRKTIQLTCP